MLNRKNVIEISHEAYQLRTSSKFNVSRAIRRFLQNWDITTSVTGETFVIQSFAFEEGYSSLQLAAIEKYAQSRVTAQAEYLVNAQDEYKGDITIRSFGTVACYDFGLVNNTYSLPFAVETASLAQLQLALKMVEVLADMLVEFAKSPAKTAAFEDYAYRGLGCSIAPDSELWMVCGLDKRNGGSGVLEWCFDEDDAQHRLDMMKRYPERFIDVSANSYASEAAGLERQQKAKATL